MIVRLTEESQVIPYFGNIAQINETNEILDPLKDLDCFLCWWLSLCSSLGSKGEE